MMEIKKSELNSESTFIAGGTVAIILGFLSHSLLLF